MIYLKLLSGALMIGGVLLLAKAFLLTEDD